MTPDELGKLVADWQKPLELFAQHWTDWAPDVVQEAFVQLYQQDKRIDQPKAWLYKTVRNLAIDRLRSESSRKTREEKFARQHVSIVATSELLAESDIEHALSELSPELKEIVIARIWGGLGYEELAEVFDVAISTVHRRYKSALSELGKQMGAPCQKSN